MTHDVTFVTAVYDDLHESEFSGRHNRGTQYAFSLAQMHSLGVPIYCFTDKLNMSRFFPVLYKHGLDNFNFIGYNLNEFPLYDKIQAVKSLRPDIYRDLPAWKTRCVEIMWGKFEWIIHVAEKIGLEGDKYLYWIDAGLSHPGVFPLKYNSNYKKGTYCNNAKDYNERFYFDKIFNEDLPDYLAEFTGVNKLLHFMCTSPQHSDYSHLSVPETKFIGTAVGGLFGGNVKMFHEWASEARQVCLDLVNNNYLIKEEDILSYLINKHFYEEEGFEDRLKLVLFDTWYHEDWLIDWKSDLYDPKREITFAEFFEPFVNRHKT